jgi:hypothetical protein
MTDAMLAGWRAEVRVVWPDLDDDSVLLPRLLDAQLFWVWLTTWQFFSRPEAAQSHSSSLADTPPDTLVLIERWRHLADAATAAGVEDVANHSARVSDALRSRFNRHDRLPLYPAFR